MPKLRTASAAALVTLLALGGALLPVTTATAAEDESSGGLSGFFEDVAETVRGVVVPPRTEPVVDPIAPPVDEVPPPVDEPEEPAPSAPTPSTAPEETPAPEETEEPGGGEVLPAPTTAPSQAPATPQTGSGTPVAGSTGAIGGAAAPANVPVISTVAAPGATWRAAAMTTNRGASTSRASTPQASGDLDTLAAPVAPSVGEASSQTSATTTAAEAGERPVTSTREMVTTTATVSQVSTGALLALAGLLIVGALVLVVARITLRLRQRREDTTVIE